MMYVRLHIWIDYLLLFTYCGLIFFLSHQSSVPVPAWFPHIDKFIHASAYALMGLLVWRCVQHTSFADNQRILFSICFCSVYGMSDEWHQSFVVGRDSDVLDWLADTTGACLAVFIAQYWYRKLKSSAPQ